MLTEQKRRRSLRFSLWDGASWSLTVGFLEIFLSPFAVALGAVNVSIGLITTLPQFVGNTLQLTTMRLIALLGSRKRLVLTGIGLQAVVLSGMLLIPDLPSHRIASLLALSLLYWAAWLVILPAWQSWMGDLVPHEMRGTYFAKRNTIIQTVTFAAIVGGGLILHFFPGSSMNGFRILVGCGVLGRILSLVFIGFQTDVAEARRDADVFSFGDFLSNLHRNNYGRFVLYAALFALAVNMSGSYFVPYMLEEVRVSYLQFMILLAVMIAAKSLTLPIWGQLSDRYGSRKLLTLSCCLFCLPPLLVALSKNFYYLLFVQVEAGLAVGGFELCAFNFMLDGTEPAHRTRSAAYYQVLTGLGMVTGALIGGFILREAWPSPYLVAFVSSFGLRVLLSVIFLPRIREVRQVPHVSYRQLLARLVGLQRLVVE